MKLKNKTKKTHFMKITIQLFFFSEKTSYFTSKKFSGFSKTSEKALLMNLAFPPSINLWSTVKLQYIIGAETTYPFLTTALSTN